MWRKISSVIGLTSLLILVFSGYGATGVASADVNDFIITSFKADYYLTHADKQGALDIDEHINVNFTDYNHGIYRALPERYNGESLHVKVSSVTMNGSKVPYQTASENGNLVLKIGDANKTVTGAQSYEIKYHVVNVIRFVDGHDELDWNVNGTEWQQPFEAVQATLHYKDNPVSAPACYTGFYKSMANDCTFDSKDGTMTFTTTRELEAGETLTFRMDFINGSFAPMTAADRVRDNAKGALELLAAPLIVFVLAYRYWRKNGKDIKGRGTIIPEYGPPAGLGPLAVDTIYNYKLSTKAISATLIDLAIRKYIRIIETDKDKLIGKQKIFSLELLNADQGELNSYEIQILDAIFGGELKVVEMNSLKNKFYTTSQSLQKKLPMDLTIGGYFVKNPKNASGVLLGLGFTLLFVSFYLFGVSWQLALSGILSGAILAFFAVLMPKRTQKGVDAKDAIEGLKLYMNVAEKDRIKMLQSPDAPYAPQSDAPAQTVELFEKLLPYAIVLGVEGQWAKQFESIYTTPPDWYSGNWTAFNAGYLVGSLDNSMSVMSNSFSAPASSGSGAGGGFSGGGGGGGGGGGW